MDTQTLLTFQSFGKISRLSRDMVITEKLDGTNAQVIIGPNGEFLTASRNRLITPQDDNYGFSAWAHANKDELMKLGVGRHFGEWWGQGIQRRYGLQEKRFSLFNVNKWNDENKPACCHVVPVLLRHTFCTEYVELTLDALRINGSFAAPGYMNPEGIIVFHSASGTLFKKTFEHDAEGKSLHPAA